MSKKITAIELAEYLDADLIGNNVLINDVKSIHSIENGSLCFIGKDDFSEDTSKLALIIITLNKRIDKNSKSSYLRVKNPRLAYARIVQSFFYQRSFGMSGSACVSKDSTIGSDVFIGENVVIEENVSIGDNTIIKHNVVILKNTTIGESCIINPGVVIGDDGLGSLQDDDGNLIMIRHLGNVIIGNYVEVGANSTIARGTMDETIIRNYNKIGPQVNIGHNSIIDENCEIAGRACLSGSVQIGKNCFIGANCSIKENIAIGDKCKVGIGAVVTKNVSDGTVVMGLEATTLKQLAIFRKKNLYGSY